MTANLCLTAARSLSFGLNRWTWNIPVRAEYAAIPFFRAKHRFTRGAFPEELTGISRHRLLGLLSTMWTRYRRLEFYFSRFHILSQLRQLILCVSGSLHL